MESSQKTEFKSNKKPTSEPGMNSSEVFSLAVDLGFRIAIPIVIFGIGGRYLDKKFATEFLFMLAGIILALVSTTLLIIFKMKKILSELQDTKTEVNHVDELTK